MSVTEEAWAQLVSTTDNETEPVLLKKDKFIIGRSKAADLCFFGNKLVSGTHCFIERGTFGSVWLQDTSTNGTLVNLTKKLTGQREELKHGDEIHVVYRKNDPSLNVSYLYQDMEELQREAEQDSSEATQEATQEYSFDMDTTAENSDVVDVPTASPSDPSASTAKRKAENDSITEGKSQSMKKPKLTEDSKSEESKEITCVVINEPTESSTKPDCDKANDKPDAFEESLICIICQEILHDCISCQPCMHSFCAGCYSDWMSRSLECPSCRGKVERVNKNYVINNLVDAYLKEHPEKKRSEDELKVLDERSKIAKDSMKPPNPSRRLSDLIDEEDEDEDDGDLSDSGCSDDDDDDPSRSGGNDGGIAPAPFGTVVTGFGMLGYKPPKTICRQCPEYKPTGASTSTGKPDDTKPVSEDTNGAGTSTSSGTGCGDKVTPTLPPYKCRATQIHILCQCCLQPMPDRRTESYTDKTVPSQQCVLCYRMYCHMYWGCTKDGCNGCLDRFKDMKFGPKDFTGLILQNAYESDIFQNHVEKNGMNMNDLVKLCLEKLDTQEYTCMDQARGLTSNSILCYGCGMRNLRDLAYQYRKSIPKDDLPAAVTSRPDCYWGSNCRTQCNKINHAAKFNHICAQTHFQ